MRLADILSKAFGRATADMAAEARANPYSGSTRCFHNGTVEWVGDGWQCTNCDAGLYVVPREPTREMWAAAGTAVVETRQRSGNHDDMTNAVWKAMLKASRT